MGNTKLSSEGKYVLDTFTKSFDKYKNTQMAIYGIGLNTRVLLENIQNYNIVGLMDAASTEKSMLGYKLLSHDEVIEKVKIIIIVARKSVTNIIYKRIEFLEKDYGIQIYNIEGKKLSEANEDSFNIENIDYWNTSEEQLLNQIYTHDIISFDVFDTLIMRKILKPQNIFDIVERELSEKHNVNIKFKQIRIDSEIELNETMGTPNIHNIYDKLKGKLNIDDELKELIKSIEFQTELKYVIPRDKMVEMFEYALKSNKQVYLLSDMYLPKEWIKKLLNKCGIKGYIDLIVSCDVKATKANGRLYEYYKSLVRDKDRLLHVGDNISVDIEMAKTYSLDTFYILSGYDMLMTSSLKELLVNVNGIEDTNILGLFVAKAFNNPFVLNKGKGKLIVDDLFIMGYLFIGPLVLSFVVWLIYQLRISNYDKILFTARDGYLVEQVYKMLTENVNEELPKSVYFKTSRRAVTVAAICNEEDILNILRNPFKGSKTELLKERFGIILKGNEEENSIRLNNNRDMETYILGYKEKIIENAQDEKKFYMEYIKKCGILNDKKIAIFDFVSSGTVQYYLSKMIKKELTGFYFVKVNVEDRFYNKSNNIIALFGESNQYCTKNNISKCYMFLEAIFTDPNATLIRCDSDGGFKYDDEKIKLRNFSDINKCHEGIKTFIKEIKSIDESIINRVIDNNKTDEILGILHSSKCIVSNEIQNSFYLEIEYDCEKECNVWTVL